MATRLAACLCCLAAHLAFGSGASAQAPVRKIKRKMSDSFAAMPDFICAESIERTERTGSAAPVPLLPLSVAAGVIDRKEQYVQPSTDSDALLLRGVLAQFGRAGTGSFALYSRAVFLTSDATYYEMPEESWNGRRMSRLDFAMPRELSRYALPHEGGPVAAGYTGSIWTDPSTLDVVKLTLRSGDIPRDVGIQEVSQSLEYGSAGIPGLSAPIPTTMDLTLLESSGRELRFLGRFSDCQPYSAKPGERLIANIPASPARVAPANPAAPNTSSAPAPGEERLPAKTIFETMSGDPIDERTTKQGSKISFTISRDIKKRGKVMAPKGSVVMGHITRIVWKTYEDLALKRYYIVGIQLDSLEVGNQRFRVWANLESVGPPADSICFVPFSDSPDRYGDFDDHKLLLTTPDPQPGESLLGIVREYLRLPSRLRMFWTVVEPPK